MERLVAASGPTGSTGAPLKRDVTLLEGWGSCKFVTRPSFRVREGLRVFHTRRPAHFPVVMSRGSSLAARWRRCGARSATTPCCTSTLPRRAGVVGGPRPGPGRRSRLRQRLGVHGVGRNRLADDKDILVTRERPSYQHDNAPVENATGTGSAATRSATATTRKARRTCSTSAGLW